MLPTSTELYYFLEVANTLNMSRAAERLGISQPALTLAIQRLEDHFGQPILLRGKGGVRLTRAGEKLMVQARHLLSEWERIRTEASKDESEIRGRYVIGCHPSVALYTLPLFLHKILEQNSELDIKLVHDLSRKVAEDVISFKVDFGIVVNPPPHPELVIKNLFDDVVTMWSRARPTLQQDLDSGKAVLIYDPELVQSQTLLKQLAKQKWNFARHVTSSNLEVITSLVASGAGLGIIPKRVATRIKGMGLHQVKSSFKFEDKICLVYRADAQKSHASRKLSQLITNYLKSPADTCPQEAFSRRSLDV